MTFRIAGVVIFLFGLLSPVMAAAHVGHDEGKKEAVEEPAAESSIYSVEEGDTEPGEPEEDDLFGSPLSRSDLEEDDLPGADMPMMKNMDHAAAGQEEHEKKIELAEHEWVSPSRKGYGFAVAITVLSGLVFGLLGFKRPGE